MRKALATFLLILPVAAPAWAEELKSERDLKPLATKAMEKAAKGDFVGALDVIKPYVAIPEAEFQTVASKSKARRDQIASRVGAPIGYEFIGQKKVGDSLIRLTYIEKTEKHALPWVFFFYKTKSGWIVNNFQWNDQVTPIFY